MKVVLGTCSSDAEVNGGCDFAIVSHMVISVMGDQAEVAWQASPKNASVSITTNSLPQTIIKEAARGEGTLICQ